MKTHIRFSEPSFIEKENEIYCYLTIKDRPAEIGSYALLNTSFYPRGVASKYSHLKDKMISTFGATYFGIARKKDNDVSDILTAKEIAYKKARRQALKAVNDLYADIFNQMDKVINAIAEEFDNNLDSIHQIDDRIHYLTDINYKEEWDFPKFSSNSIGLTNYGDWFRVIQTPEKEFLLTFNSGVYLWVDKNNEKYVSSTTGYIVDRDTMLPIDKIIYMESDLAPELCNYNNARQHFNQTLETHECSPHQWFRYKSFSRYK